jgi:hypothetical protein
MLKFEPIDQRRALIAVKQSPLQLRHHAAFGAPGRRRCPLQTHLAR